MELEEKLSVAAVSESILYSGSEVIVIAAGKTLTIETTPAGVEVLSVEVPAGKSWSVRVGISVVETNA